MIFGSNHPVAGKAGTRPVAFQPPLTRLGQLGSAAVVVSLVPFVLAAVISTGCAARTQSQSTAALQGGSEEQPIRDADPSIRSPRTVRVPTKLKIERTTNTLTFGTDYSSLESTNIMVGLKMAVGIAFERWVYREGEARPPRHSREVTSSLDSGSGAAYYHAEEIGIPVPGEKYVAEMEITIFETNIPPQRRWSPFSEKYRILWRRTLRQIVE